MDQSWRFRPVQGNICPTCSISHFPFCPQPPAFNRNAFPLENDYAFHRPFFDNRGPPEVPCSLLRSDYRFNPMISVPRNTNDVYGDSQNWYGDQNLRIDSFRQFPQSSEMVDSASGSGFRGDGFQPPVINPGSDLFLKGEPDEMGRFSKRMKIEERSFTHMPPSVRGDYCLNLANTSRMSSEDERRLSLVRDHGGQPSTLQSQRVTDSLGGTSLAIGHKQNGFYNGISLQQRNLKYADAAGKANFDDSEIIRTDMPLKLQDNIRAEHLHRELGGYGQQHVQSKRSGFGSDAGHTFFQNREGGMGAFLVSQYEECLRPHGQTENLLHPSMQTIGHTYIPRSGPNFLKSDQRNQDSEVLHGREEYWHKMDGGDGPFAASQSGNLNQYSHMSRDVPLHISGGSNEMYHAANLQKYQPKDSVPANDLIYPGMTNWQGSSQSNALHHEQRSSWTEHCAPNSQLPQSYARQQPFQNSHDHHFHAQKNDTRQSFEQKPESVNDIQGSVGPCKNQRGYITMPAVTSMGSTNLDQLQISRAFVSQPPLPPLTPPHTVDPTGQPASDLQVTSSLPVVSSSLFPIPATSWATVPLSHSHTPEGQLSSQAYFHNKPSNGFTLEGSQIVLETSSTKYLKGQNFPAGNISSDKPKIIDASHIFKKPYRDNCPDHIVIILRGLPGSGKSYLAKMLRDLEVENGGAAPRIHSMDDYFMTEVEKVEESEGSSSLVKGKKAITKRVMEYCYEPEMEEAYRSSMLKAFKKNLEEGIFTCIIVDDRNLRVADFAQFWAIAKRSGYEAYLLEATYKDPVGCAARNVHGFNQDDIQKMALQWEEAPPLYLKLDIQSLFHGDELNEHGIQEVDMDMEDEACDEGLSELPDRKCDRVVEPAGGDHESVGSLKNIEGWNAEGDDPEEVKELGRSKWSDDLDEAVRTPENSKGNSNALSGLIQAYGRGGKSVHWGDKAGKTGFSIGAVKAANMSLVIGPGAGYNLKSNPLPEEEDAGAVEMGGESKKRSMFQEQLRAERESFRAIFDRRRRQRIGGLEVEDE